MERLTYRNELGDAMFVDGISVCPNEVANRLAYYEDMEEQGRQQFPCKPGDTVYFIYRKTNGEHEIKEGFALCVKYSFSRRPLVTIRYNDATLDTTMHYLGLKAFMTREESEQALKGGAN